MSDVRDRRGGEPAGAPTLQDVEVLPPAPAGERLPATVAPPRRSLTTRLLAPVLRRQRGPLVLRQPFVEPPHADEVRARERRRIAFAVAISLVLVVVLPILAGGVYLFAFASDQYVADMRFVVRKADAPRNADGVVAPTGGTSVQSTSLLSGGTNLSGEDAEIIADYIHSRAVVEDVGRTVDVQAIFQRPEADLLARLWGHPKIEKLVKYWNRMVGVYVEPSSGIVTVKVTAFRREDALTLAKAILAASDRLANSLTLKMRADQTRLAEDEVRRAEGAVRFALADLTAFRNSQRLIDPVESSKNSGKLLMELIGDRIQTESQLFVMQRAQGPNAPGISGIKARLQSINQHVNELQDQMAGNRQMASNMAATLSQFEELEVKRQFSEKLFEFARQGLERAQLAALSTSIYLAVFMPPSLPQEYTYPNRFTTLAILSLAAIMTWISGTTIVASVLDHRL